MDDCVDAALCSMRWGWAAAMRDWPHCAPQEEEARKAEAEKAAAAAGAGKKKGKKRKKKAKAANEEL